MNHPHCIDQLLRKRVIDPLKKCRVEFDVFIHKELALLRFSDHRVNKLMKVLVVSSLQGFDRFVCQAKIQNLADPQNLRKRLGRIGGSG